MANEFFDHHEYMEHPTDLAELCWSQQENHEFVNTWNESTVCDPNVWVVISWELLYVK